MTQPTEEEINRALAEFMGYRVEHTGIHQSANYISEHYTSSLDALIPVVEKIYERDVYEPVMFKINSILSDGWLVETVWAHHDGDITMLKTNDKSPSLALSTALYHVIKDK